MARIYKQPLAEQDLINIWRYTFETWGEKQADTYLDELENIFQLLATQPNLGRMKIEFAQPVRFFIHAHDLIVYQTISHGISVVRVLHKSMDVITQLNTDF